MELIPLAVIGIGALAMSQTPRPVPPSSTDDLRLSNMIETHKRDIHDGGMVYSQQRTQYVNTASLRQNKKPWSAPLQEPTRELSDVFNDTASSYSFYEKYGPEFYFNDTAPVPLATPQQSVLHIEVPSKNGIRGGTSLGTQPRAYIDCLHGCDPALYSDDKRRTQRVGESEVYERYNVPPTGFLNYLENPQGSGGVVQRIYAERNARQTMSKHTNQDNIIGQKGLFRRRRVY